MIGRNSRSDGGGGGQKYVWFDCSGLSAPFTREWPRQLGGGGGFLNADSCGGRRVGKRGCEAQEKNWMEEEADRCNLISWRGKPERRKEERSTQMLGVVRDEKQRWKKES